VPVPKKVRQSRLVQFLKTYEPRIHYMYYDVDWDKVVAPATDPQFNDTLKPIWDHS